MYVCIYICVCVCVCVYSSFLEKQKLPWMGNGHICGRALLSWDAHTLSVPGGIPLDLFLESQVVFAGSCEIPATLTWQLFFLELLTSWEILGQKSGEYLLGEWVIYLWTNKLRLLNIMIIKTTEPQCTPLSMTLLQIWKETLDINTRAD